MEGNLMDREAERWISRAFEKGQSQAGYSIMACFMSKMPDVFKEDGAAPKDWDRAAEALGVALASRAPSEALEDFVAAAPGLIMGPAGQALSNYFEKALKPMRLAERALAGTLSKEDLDDLYQLGGNGYETGSVAFREKFASFLASGVAGVLNDEHVDTSAKEQAVRKYVDILHVVKDDAFKYGLSLMNEMTRLPEGRAVFKKRFGNVLEEVQSREQVRRGPMGF